MNSSTIKKVLTWTSIILLVMLMVGSVVWFFFRGSSPISNAPSGSFFNTPIDNSTNTTPGNSSTTNGLEPATSTQTPVTQQKIFKIADGPVVGATFIQTLHPTTTLMRYIAQDNGHVFDLPVDVPGAVPRVVSNTTIPGGVHALWVEGGSAAVMQYIDQGTIKTVYMGFPKGAGQLTSTTSPLSQAPRILFLPNNIADIAASPDGTSLVYLIKTSTGVDGYIAKSDGTNSKKLFSLPLSQMLISWPSPTTLLAQTKSAAEVPGIAFSVDVKSGVAVPLLYAQGLIATADGSFLHVAYQTANGSTISSYVHDVKQNSEVPLSSTPITEGCIWSNLNKMILYCVSPLSQVPTNFLDLQNQGLSNTPDIILHFDISKGVVSAAAIPGTDGGISSVINELSLSSDEHYLSFTTKGDRSLWGVRLTQ